MIQEVAYFLVILAWLAMITLPNLKCFSLQYDYALADGFSFESEQDDLATALDSIATFKKNSKTNVQSDPAIGQAAMRQAELGEDWLSFAEKQFEIANDRQIEQDKIANQVTQQQLEASKQSQQWATQDRNRYTDTFVPLQDEFINDAKNWDSPERQAELAAAAKADVMNNASLARQATERNMSSMGVDPTSGRYAAVNRAGDLSTTLAAAGAENNARSTVRNQGMALKGEAINLGSGLGVNPASSLSLSSQTGSAAYGTTSANNAQAAGNASIMGQGYQGAMNGYNNQASILNQQHQNKIQAQQMNNEASNSMWSTIGSVAGMGAMMLSDEDLKEDKQQVDGALDAVKSMRVEKWKYKDGVADGGEHIGPYAQDFQQATGLGDGHSINVVDGIGLTLKAVQELGDKVDQLEKGEGRGLSRKKVS